MLASFFQTILSSVNVQCQRVATSRSQISSFSFCSGSRTDMGYSTWGKLLSSCSTGLRSNYLDRNHPYTYWSLLGPRGSHMPEFFLDSFCIWNNSTSKPTRTDRVSELRCIVTQMSPILAELNIFWVEIRAWLIQFVKGMFACTYSVFAGIRKIQHIATASRLVICSSVLQRWNIIDKKNGELRDRLNWQLVII